MVAAGWEVGAHTLTHPDLTTVDDAGLQREIAGSRTLLQDRLHLPVNAFCYPAGRNDARVRAAVRAAGFKTATTVDPGIARPGDDPFALPRIRVNGTDSPQTVLEHVRTGAGASGSGGGRTPRPGSGLRSLVLQHRHRRVAPVERDHAARRVRRGAAEVEALDRRA